MIGSIIAWLVLGIIAGAYLAIARSGGALGAYRGHRDWARITNWALVLVAPVLLHAAFDFPLLALQRIPDLSSTTHLLLGTASVLIGFSSIGFAVRLVRRLGRHHAPRTDVARERLSQLRRMWALLLIGGLGGLVAPHAEWWVYLFIHPLLSLGLALMFTPLFTAGLGSLPGHLYSHGSSILGTLQQVAAGAGTALAVTVMTSRAESLAKAGENQADAVSGGVSLAMWAAAGICCLAVALTFFVKKPAEPAMGH